VEAEKQLVAAAYPDPPKPGRDNPYQLRLHESLERRGVRFLPHASLRPLWVRTERRRLDVVHLHWPEFVGWGGGGRLVRALRAHARGLLLVRALRAYRRAGVRIVWTVHNLRPHESRWPWLDRLLYGTAVRVADRLVVHSPTAAERVAQTMGRSEGVVVAPLGNFDGTYPAERRTRAEMRAALGVPEEAFVYLSFGQIRPYKRIPELISAFRAAADERCVLIVAGSMTDPETADAVRAAAAGDARVRLDARFVPEQEVAGLHLAADAAVIPYREVFSSAALMLALTFGLPVVAPRSGAALDAAEPPAVELFEEGRLADALRAVRSGDQPARREAARAAAARASWDTIGERLAAVYRGEL
jgi:glycosyltransferase involved in cell wall biosynthesis